LYVDVGFVRKNTELYPDAFVQLTVNCAPFAEHVAVRLVGAGINVHFAYTERVADTGVVARNCVPPPFVAVYHPSNIYPVLIGSVGSVPTFVAGEVTDLVAGVAAVVAL
jgi:hypothetical protein